MGDKLFNDPASWGGNPASMLAERALSEYKSIKGNKQSLELSHLKVKAQLNEMLSIETEVLQKQKQYRTASEHRDRLKKKLQELQTIEKTIGERERDMYLLELSLVNRRESHATIVTALSASIEELKSAIQAYHSRIEKRKLDREDKKKQSPKRLRRDRDDDAEAKSGDESSSEEAESGDESSSEDEETGDESDADAKEEKHESAIKEV